MQSKPQLPQHKEKSEVGWMITDQKLYVPNYSWLDIKNMQQRCTCRVDIIYRYTAETKALSMYL